MYKALLATAAILVGAPAFAGGTAPAPAPAPMIVPVAATSDWTGAYAGLQLEMLDGSAALGGGFDGDTFGLFGGYRHDFGSFVLGGEIDYMNGQLSQAGGSGSLDIDSLVRIGLEAGFDAGPALIYGTVGMAMLDVSVGPVSRDANGTFFGIGVDYLLSDRVTLGAEILRHDFSDFADIPGNDIEFTTFGVNIAYRF
jgi:outer membrane immunogenic protein